MGKIISITTALPAFTHRQMDILHFMNDAYQIDEREQRKLHYLYKFSAIEQRHSVLQDFVLPPEERKFYSRNHLFHDTPTVEERMKKFNEEAPLLALEAVQKLKAKKITHLITVSCTGMSAPGLDLLLMEQLQLPANTERTAINFMGCYAAVHALKQANYIVNSNPQASVVIVCVELCSLHFQTTYTLDSIAATLLFGDGCAAAHIVSDGHPSDGLLMKSFYSEVQFNGKSAMAWEVASNGFIMTLNNYVSQLIETDLLPLVQRACAKATITPSDINYWCMHPGGKKILEAMQKGLSLPEEALKWSKEVLRVNGNMSSATILFVLSSMFDELLTQKNCHVFGAAFGPGLTMESIILSHR